MANTSYHSGSKTSWLEVGKLDKEIFCLSILLVATLVNFSFLQTLSLICSVTIETNRSQHQRRHHHPISVGVQGKISFLKNCSRLKRWNVLQKFRARIYVLVNHLKRRSYLNCMTLLDYLKTLLNLRFMTETTPIVLESF